MRMMLGNALPQTGASPRVNASRRAASRLGHPRQTLSRGSLLTGGCTGRCLGSFLFLTPTRSPSSSLIDPYFPCPRPLLPRVGSNVMSREEWPFIMTSPTSERHGSGPTRASLGSLKESAPTKATTKQSSILRASRPRAPRRRERAPLAALHHFPPGW